MFSRHPHLEAAPASAACVWTGESGTDYLYQIYSLDAEFRPLPGNYLYAMQTEDGLWVPIYIAQTRDLHQRLEGHVRTSDAIANGATHLHAHYCAAGQATRCNEERDLIKRWQPVCNEVLES
jgi:predicted GIY-YIG superfamily endonuclease